VPGDSPDAGGVIYPHPADLAHPAQHASRQGEETMMVMHSTEVAERSEHKEMGPVMRSVGGLLLALAVVAGIGGWHLAQQRSDTATTAIQQNSNAGMAGANQEGRGSTAHAQTFNVYIVGSEDEVAHLQWAIAERDHTLAGSGTPPFNAEVVTVNSAEQESSLMQATAELDATRVSISMPGLTVIDLRAGEK
jgi:hypothetical protein